MAWDGTHRNQAAARDRGYGRQHREQRERWAKAVARGGVTCTRCGEPVTPWEPWHLDHDDVDRTIYRGVAHASCNLRAGAVKGRAVQTGMTIDDRQAVSREW